MMMMMMMPGGSSAPDRFIRASLYARHTFPGADGESTVWVAWHVMNMFDVPPGVMRNVEAETKKESTEYSNLLTCVADTKNMVYYLRAFDDNGIYEIDFKKMDPTGPKRLLSMATARPGARSRCSLDQTSTFGKKKPAFGRHASV
jgi:penicillin V acylase-like amidase (Ntn superfamily)